VPPTHRPESLYAPQWDLGGTNAFLAWKSPENACRLYKFH